MMSFQPWEPRVSRLEGAFEQFPERLNDLRGEVNALRGEVNAVRGEVNALRGDMNVRFQQADTALHADMQSLRGDTDAKIDTLRATMDSHFRWTMATMIALFASLGAFLHLVH